MPLPPYTQYFNDKSLVRAVEYLDSVKINESGSRRLKAKVRGSYKYKVKIEWNENGEYTVLKCSCPYKYDGYCKHIGAVLMYVEKNPEIINRAYATGDPEFTEINEG